MSLLKKNLPIDLPVARPKSLGEAKRLIAQTFAENDWKTDEQTRYLASLEIEGDLKSLGKIDTRKIIDDLEKYRMILLEK